MLESLKENIPLLIIMSVSAGALLGAFGLNLYNSITSNRRRRRKLVNAIYHHAALAESTLKEQQKRLEEIEDKIGNEESYTPYVPRSPADDLTYDQIIEVMEWLDKSGEEAVSSYFHHQMGLHAIAQSFDLDFVRNWPSDRRLSMWKGYKYYLEKTIKYSSRTRSILESKRVPP